MGVLSFRQLVACVVMVAMCCNTAAPMGICWCEGCHCEMDISRFLPGSATVGEKCCCTPPETQPDDGCCGLPETPCTCPCGDAQKSKTPVPAAVLPGKMPNLTPAWSVVSVFPIGFADAPKVSSYVDHFRTSLPLHVPLHVLLCVFLN